MSKIRKEYNLLNSTINNARIFYNSMLIYTRENFQRNTSKKSNLLIFLSIRSSVQKQLKDGRRNKQVIIRVSTKTA